MKIQLAQAQRKRNSRIRGSELFCFKIAQPYTTQMCLSCHADKNCVYSINRQYNVGGTKSKNSFIHYFFFSSFPHVPNDKELGKGAGSVYTLWILYPPTK